MVYVGWIPHASVSSGPVDVKDLLNDGGLCMFGDRYSHLMHELQVAIVLHFLEKDSCQCRCQFI